MLTVDSKVPTNNSSYQSRLGSYVNKTLSDFCVYWSLNCVFPKEESTFSGFHPVGSSVALGPGKVESQSGRSPTPGVEVLGFTSLTSPRCKIGRPSF